MQVSSVKGRVGSLLLNGYRRSHVLRWLYGLTLRNHWRQLHTRDSCVYGFVNLASILLDLIQIRSGVRSCDSRTVRQLESALASIFGVSQLTTFSSGRNSQRAILKAMEIGEGDEVIIPGLTCVVVPYTILHCGARPVYVDIGRDYRMNLDLLRASLTPRTKAIIAQHTFGLPEKMSDIVPLAKERGIRVIEDCTHVLPGTGYEGELLGTLGDAAYFSFDRGKTISAGWGGAVITRNEEIGRRLSALQQGVSPLSRDENLRIGTQLFLTILTHHPDLFGLLSLARPWLSRKGVFPRSVPETECRGDPPSQLLGQLADIQADLLMSQIKQLSSISERRSASVRAFAERLGGPATDLPLMWYPLQVRNRDEAVENFRKHQIELRTWKAPLTPVKCDTARALYQWGSCPVAEEISRGCVALPTMLRKNDLDRVLNVATRCLDIVHVQ
jgi:perosamine synthetase